MNTIAVKTDAGYRSSTMPGNDARRTAMHSAAEAAVLRRLQAPDEFTIARSARLPANKADFPRLVTLDMCHWVAMARVHYGKQSTPAAAIALSALRLAVATGKAIIAATDINISEASSHDDAGRWQRLAQFMVELSHNHCLPSHIGVARGEAWNSLAALFAPERVGDIRSTLLRWGYGHAFGRRPLTSDDAFASVANEILDYPELSINQIVNVMDRDELRTLFASESATIDKVRAVRAMDQDLPDDEHLRREFSNFPRDWLAPILQELRVERQRFEALVADAGALASFWRSVPSVDVLFTLMMARDRNADARTHKNDARDLSFMRLAIPYSNIVLGENLWTHIANSTGLASKYGTTVISDLARVPDVLREHGCP